jgi:hypothetical protein
LSHVVAKIIGHRGREALAGCEPSPGAIAAAAAAVPGALGDAFGDIYASADYRTHPATVLSRPST